MKLKTLDDKIRYRVKRSKNSVFLPQDFFDLSDRDQVGRSLRNLMEEGLMIKIGYGLYARARKSSATGRIIPEKGLRELAEEALERLGVSYTSSRAEKAYNAGETTQVPTGRVIAVKDRISRKIGYNGKFIKFEYAAR